MEMSSTEKKSTHWSNVDSQVIRNALKSSHADANEDLGGLIFGTPNWRDKLRLTQENPYFHRSWEQIRSKAVQAMSEPLPELSFALFRQFAETGARKVYEDIYFERRARLNALSVLTAVITDEPEHTKYIVSLENVIWEICGEYTWCLPAHLPAEGDPTQEVDLFAAETAQTLAEIYAMYEGELDRRVTERIRTEVRRRVLTPVFTEKRPFFWRNSDHNWSAVCAGGSGMAALILMTNSEEQAEAVEQVLGSLQSFLSGYGADGGCAEGLGYWVYGFGYFTYFSEMLREYTIGKIDLLAASHTQAIARFPSSIHLSGGVYVNFSDSSEREVLPSGLLSRLEERTGNINEIPFLIPGMLDDPVRRWAHLIRNFLWSSGNKDAKQSYNNNFLTEASERTLLDTAEFPDLGWWVSRGTVPRLQHQVEQSNGLAVGFALKGGHNGEPHNHNDLGQFIVLGGGESLLCDLGAGMYTKAYFQEGRESIINISSGGHNVPIIGGYMQQSGGEYVANVLESRTDKEQLIVKLDLTSAYSEAPIRSFIRYVHFRCPSIEERTILQLEDIIEWQEAAESVEERLISQVSPVIGKDNVTWSGSRARLILTYDSARWTASCIETSHFTHEGEPFIFYTTSLVSTDHDDNETRCRLQFDIEEI
ncbi:heparinase II/III family protein [Paenibacillus sp. Marseille-Q4541]|uniref:heparinase II/III family protein n=1 Tax=Paenibacillus sp. Marseille-Q4541 TaxID=2831522 RepID=UPI001BAB426E|nr:heparinase II/III family protein [Paenibacillus sp. Marseille-Q4541]